MVRDGRVLWRGSTGRLWVHGPRVRAADRFVIASATKPVVATIVLRLAEEGRLGLDDPVARWLPQVANAERITVRMLLSHHSGLREYFGDPRMDRALGDPRHRWTRAEVLRGVVRRGAERAPGGPFAYRNTNYVLLGDIVERASGHGVGALLRRLVTAPLGLTTLSFGTTPGRLAHGHEREGGATSDLWRPSGRPPTDALGPVWTDGGLASDATDLARFADGVFGGRVLQPATLAGMTTSIPGGDGYGLGIRVTEVAGGRILEHDGLYGGFTSDLRYDTRSRTAVAAVTNLDGPGHPGPALAAAVARAIRGGGR
jgi:D-alanyl-D-alanine carboxypeptidase